MCTTEQNFPVGFEVKYRRLASRKLHSLVAMNGPRVASPKRASTTKANRPATVVLGYDEHDGSPCERCKRTRRTRNARSEQLRWASFLACKRSNREKCPPVKQVREKGRAGNLAHYSNRKFGQKVDMDF